MEMPINLIATNNKQRQRIIAKTDSSRSYMQTDIPNSSLISCSLHASCMT